METLSAPTKVNLSFNATKLPSIFYNLNDPRRFTDPYALDHQTGEMRLVLTERERFDKFSRDRAYRQWLKAFDIKPKHMKFQRVRIISDKWAEAASHDWWKNFQDALLTVFVQPETMYYGRQWLQFYIVCPEDCELIARYLWNKKNLPLPPRKNKWVTEEPRLRTAYVVPTRCCSQLRNETKGGIPEFSSVL